LADLLAESDQDTVRKEWGTDDHHPTGHGTPMAGLAAYGDLTPLLEGDDPAPLSHFLESVKILPREKLPAPPVAPKPGSKPTHRWWQFFG
jgi:hypothetical protein